MSYWKYRAFDKMLEIKEGVIISQASDEQFSFVLLQLRNQGLQCVDIRKIDKAEYDREIYLEKLKSRGRIQPKKFTSTQPKTTRNWLWKILAILFNR